MEGYSRVRVIEIASFEGPMILRAVHYFGFVKPMPGNGGETYSPKWWCV